MATAPETTAPAAAVAAVATAAAPAADPNTLMFVIPNAIGADGGEVQMSVALGDIPADTRMDLLKQAVRNYVVNSTNQAYQRHLKALGPWTAYENAQAADPLQTAVTKPEGERPTVDLIPVATEARTRLYEGKVQKRGEGSGKKREARDPLTTHVTNAVVRELFDKKKAADPKFKWTDAVTEVGSDGIAYLNKLVDEKVKAGADKAALDKFMDERYIKPAKMMLGLTDNKATTGVSLL